MLIAIKKIFNRIGFDRAVGYTVVTRVLQAINGVVVILFIAKYLNTDEQGYFYTFSSVLAIQIFFELGLSSIITQYAAYEFANLQLVNDNELIGEKLYKSRLASLLHFSVKWFGLISIALFVILLIAGFYFFGHFGSSENVQWKSPWIILCAATSLNLFIDPILAFYDGLAKVEDMARVRFIQKLSSVLLICSLLVFGFKLYASAIASLVSILINYYQIFSFKRLKTFKAIWNNMDEFKINYKKEIFPYQWRIALSWISGYFIFQLFNPVLFATSGAKVAGQMGITIAALTGISAISMSWINTKIPLMSTLTSTRKFTELDHIFKKIVLQSVGVNVVFTVLMLLFLVIAGFVFEYKIVDRFLPVAPLVFMCIANIVNNIVFALASYLRCHKAEPLLYQSIVIGILIASSTLLMGKHYGVLGICGGYCILTIVGLIWSWNIFKSKRKAWHE